jgi:hypothetical protein
MSDITIPGETDIEISTFDRFGVVCQHCEPWTAATVRRAETQATVTSDSVKTASCSICGADIGPGNEYAIVEFDEVPQHGR